MLYTPQTCDSSQLPTSKSLETVESSFLFTGPSAVNTLNSFLLGRNRAK